MKYAWRITFAFDGEKCTLKSTRRLAMRTPPGRPVSAGRTGRFIELRDGDRKVLYRRGISELIPDTIEYRTGDPARPLAHGRAPLQREVALLVPDIQGGSSVAIVAAKGRRDPASGQRAADAGIDARDLITVDLPPRGEAS